MHNYNLFTLRKLQNGESLIQGEQGIKIKDRSKTKTQVLLVEPPKVETLKQLFFQYRGCSSPWGVILKNKLSRVLNKKLKFQGGGGSSQIRKFLKNGFGFNFSSEYQLIFFKNGKAHFLSCCYMLKTVSRNFMLQ